MKDTSSNLKASKQSDDSYKPLEIEDKWQKHWQKTSLHKTREPQGSEKCFYALSMFPYPSGNLHMGHVRNYVITDVIARVHRMKGYAVLHPMGWDAFGLPAENAAIERNVHPDKWTDQNIGQMKNQLNQLGLSVDWDREQTTSKSNYYKWTQKLFLELYENGLAYQKSAQVNWDPVDQTVLANEQVDNDGRSWRSGAIVEKKDLKQWFLRITDYADELLNDLTKLPGWPERVRVMQSNWIGKSQGTKITFKVNNERNIAINVFTTRPDTLYGCTYIVLSPENKLVDEIVSEDYKKALKDFRDNLTRLTDQERISENKPKSGIDLGVEAINPVNGKLVPIWIADYVLAEYGTGAVMGVPAHDQRDYDFSKKYSLPIVYVIKEKNEKDKTIKNCAFIEKGILTNSSKFDGLDSEIAKDAITDRGISENWSERITTYKLRDWLISRQRYWGCPIPIIYCKDCGIVPVPKDELPVELPSNLKITGKGNSPLQNSSWTNTTCPNCSTNAVRESDTMDTFMCSSWYFLRFADPHNENDAFDKNQVDKWLPVDQYVGGVEHAILHLLYSRFITKVLNKNGLIDIAEPFKNLLTQGMVQGVTYKNPKTNKYIKLSEIRNVKNPIDPKTSEPLEVIYEKMSKSKYNGIEPNIVVKKYGADTARMFILFKAPPEKDLEWDDADVEGQYRFLQRIWRLVKEVSKENNICLETKEYNFSEELNKDELELRRSVHTAIKEITEDLNKGKQLNTAVSELMKLSNSMNELIYRCNDKVRSEAINILIRLLAPFAPHIAEELWTSLGALNSVHIQEWPKHDTQALVKSTYDLIIQLNGKVRGSINVQSKTNNKVIEELALNSDIARKWLGEKPYKRIIIVPGKLINIVF